MIILKIQCISNVNFEEEKTNKFDYKKDGLNNT